VTDTCMDRAAKKRAYDRTYHRANKAKSAITDKAYRVANKVKRAKQHHDYYIKHKESVTQYQKAYRAKNSAKIAARQSAYNHAHRETIAETRLRMLFGRSAAKLRNAMLDHQGFQCAICAHPDGIGHGKCRATQRLAVDHCHFSGQVRGMLCSRCNRGLGYFTDPVTKRDSITNLQNAVQYLLDHQEGPTHAPQCPTNAVSSSGMHQAPTFPT